MLGRVLIALFHDQHAVASFGQVLRCNTASAATAHDNDIGFDRLGIVAWRNLNELERSTIRRDTVHGSAGDSQNGTDRWAHGDPCLLENGGQTPENRAHRWQTGRLPTSKDLFANLERLIREGCC